MFKIGDIVSPSQWYLETYPKRYAYQKYIITYQDYDYDGEALYEIKGLEDNIIFMFHWYEIKLDKQYTRKLKLKDICSKLEMSLK
jgi:hypothetical protein